MSSSIDPQSSDASGTETRLRVADATCTACGCLCDDLILETDGERIVEATNACELGRGWFLADHGHQGIPFKSLKLAMHAKGGDLQYDTKSPNSARRQRRSSSPIRRVSLPKPRETLEAGVSLVTTSLILTDTDPPKPEPTPAPAADDTAKVAP
ncbi:hypothetical protein ACYOEI_42440, partial [Singulisphaera rosea]